jgi:hemoglobin
MRLPVHAALVSMSLLAAPLAGCAGSSASKQPVAAQKSLYDRLGGKESIAAVVDKFVGKVAADNRINARFANTDIPHLKQMLTDQICEASGGPCKYTGKDMKTSHAGMKITEDEFNALVEDLQKTLDEFKVPADAQKDLIGALAPMKPDIVGQ